MLTVEAAAPAAPLPPRSGRREAAAPLSHLQWRWRWRAAAAGWRSRWRQVQAAAASHSSLPLGGGGAAPGSASLPPRYS